VSTAIAPHEAEAVEEVNETVAAARMLEVGSPEQALAAVEFLAKIADAKKRNETARKFLVGPMNDHIKAINARFKRNAEPFDEADQLVRGRLLAYKQQEDARLAEEQAALDARRREQEAAAEAERRRQAQEAARVEREAQEGEERRQAQLREAANERAREISKLTDEELSRMMQGTGSDADLAEAEFTSRTAAREAQERADTARRGAEEAQQLEIAAKSAPAAVATTTALTSASGSASTRKVWRATVVDEELIPRHYLKIDQAAINAAVKAGERTIPGVRIEQVDELAVRTGGRS
jgi:hypothetical protein